MNKYERQWFYMMLRRKARMRLVVALYLPYWAIRAPVLLLAFILQHAAKKHADRFKS